MSILKKLLAFSLPLGLVMTICAIDQPAAVKADVGTLESPAELRLTALDTLMKGDKHNALDLYEEAIRLANKQFGPDSTFLGDLYYEAGRLYLELDQFNQAEDYLNQAVKINPKNASARLALARLLDTRAKVQDSIGQIRQALLVNPDSPVARYKFIQTLSRYGQSPSDKAMATQEAVTLAMIQKNAREALRQAHTNAPDKNISREDVAAKKAADTHALSVPTLPKHLVPLKDDEDKAAAKNEAVAIQNNNAKTAPATESGDKTAPAAKGFSLFPLQDMSARKQKEDKEQAEKARAEAANKDKTNKEGAEVNKPTESQSQPKKAGGDIVDQMKQQARQHGKSKAAERAEKLERARAEKAAALEAKVAKLEAKAARLEAQNARPEAKAAKAEVKAAKSEVKANKAESKSENKTEKAAEKPAEKAAAPVQAAPQMVPVQMQPQYMPPVMYGMPVAPQFSSPPKAKPGKGFVPPPPPTLQMYPGMMPQPVMPQVIQQPKPAPAKPKVEKAKPAEAKPVEDKPPPMTSTGEAADPEFLLDWGVVPKKGEKKKSK